MYFLENTMHRALYVALAISLLLFTAGQVSAETLNLPEVTKEENLNIPAATQEETPSVVPETTQEKAVNAPPAQEKTFSVTLPGRGMTMEQVEARFGVAKQKKGPVGTPPISTWVYDKFTVYFEGRYVIHAVFETPQ